MPTLAEASLSDTERRALDRLVRLLQNELGPALHAVWLYGSRARGERPGPESDIDLIVVSDRVSPDDERRVLRLATEAAQAEEMRGVWLSTHVYHPDRIAQRRAIRSFFIQEVDRDKIVLFGEP